MEISKNIQIDLFSKDNQCIFSRRAINNTLVSTIKAASQRSINIDRLSIDLTIQRNNQHLRSKIQNFMIIHEDNEFGMRILDGIKNLGHWGDSFLTSYAGIIRFLKNPHVWSSLIMDGDQSSDYSIKLIQKIQTYKPNSRIFVLSDKKNLQSQFNHLNITYLPKNFIAHKHLTPVF